MSTTNLFIELLIVGIGGAAWVALFVAAIMGSKLDPAVFKDNPALLGLLTAAAYVLGIVVDRLARGIFMPTLEVRARRAVFTEERIRRIRELAPFIEADKLTMEIEKLIRAGSEALAAKIDYNRSRLRICRAWVWHFLLLAVAFVCWNVRLTVFQSWEVAGLVTLDLLFAGLALRATCLLAVDHQKDLAESFEILMASEAKAVKRATPGASGEDLSPAI